MTKRTNYSVRVINLNDDIFNVELRVYASIMLVYFLRVQSDLCTLDRGSERNYFEVLGFRVGNHSWAIDKDVAELDNHSTWFKLDLDWVVFTTWTILLYNVFIIIVVAGGYLEMEIGESCIQLGKRYIPHWDLRAELREYEVHILLEEVFYQFSIDTQLHEGLLALD